MTTSVQIADAPSKKVKSEAGGRRRMRVIVINNWKQIDVELLNYLVINSNDNDILRIVTDCFWRCEKHTQNK
jgi:hypothetical protein